MEKKETIAATMRHLMETGPSVAEYPNYRALNDHVGAAHGLAAGKCQALAGEKAWAWFADQTTGVWRKATEEEIAACREKAAGKTHGTRASKVMSNEDRAALDSQIAALETVNNPALEPLLADLKAKQVADDEARKGSLKDRLAAAIETLGLEQVVNGLERAIAAAADLAARDAEARDAEARAAAAENAAAENA